MIRFRFYSTASARVTEAKRITTLAKLYAELGQKLRVSIPAVRKPANIRSAAR